VKLNQIITKAFVLIVALLMPFASIPAQAATNSQTVSMEGVIVSRDGNSLLVRGAAETATTVTLTETTKVESTSSFLIFTSSKPASAAALIPGLRVKIETDSSGKQIIATSVKFSEEDFETASSIQAALAVPQQQAKMLGEKVKQQEQVIATQEQQIAANKQQNEAHEQQLAAVDKRFGDLADYDKKGETVVYFDINSTKLSDKSKADLQAIAATAKTFKGYLLQVAAYTSSLGDTASNQSLSDRRAAAVTAYLQQECDIAISRVLAPAAMGESKPVAPNETLQGRAENRRATVKILVNRGIAQ
jgi:OmpA-OmpF porin, OOP family